MASVPYDHEVDHMDQPDPHDPEKLRKTSFFKTSVVNFLARNGSTNEFVVGVAQHANGVETYTLIAQRDGLPIDTLVGHFPCPKNCIPPGMIETRNTFDRADILWAMNYADCHFLNVHSGSKGTLNGAISSLCIYGVCMDEMDQFYSRDQEGDSIFISELYTPF